MRPVTMRPEIGIGFEDGAEHAERPVLDAPAAPTWSSDQVEQRRHAAVLRPVGLSAPSSPASPSRRGSGKSSCSSLASSAANRSNTSFTTSVGRASGRSTLLMTTIGLQPDLQRLGHHELGLRHRPFGRVDQHAARRRPC